MTKEKSEIYSLMYDHNLSSKDALKLIDNVDNISGYDLIYLFQVMANLKLSGYLNIVDQINQITGISFSEGDIVKVDFPDQTTLLGNLFVQYGYITKNELEHLHASQIRGLGDKLVELKKIKKEELLNILKVQMIKRIEKYINNENYQINFVKFDTIVSVHNEVKLNRNDLNQLTWDWANLLVDIDWYDNHYISTLHKPAEFVFGKSVPKDINNFDYDFFDQIVSALKKYKFMFDVRMKYSAEVKKMYAYVHFMRLQNMLFFSAAEVINLEEKNRKDLDTLKNIFLILEKKQKIDLLKTVSAMVKVPFDNSGLLYKKFVKFIYSLAKDSSSPYRDDLFRIALDILDNSEGWIAEYRSKGSESEVHPINLDSFAKEIRISILNQNYYEVAKKIQFLKKSGFEDIHYFDFLYLWQFLIQVLKNGHPVDLRGVEKRIENMQHNELTQGDFFYVSAIYYYLRNDKRKSYSLYQNACDLNSIFINYPIDNRKVNFKTSFLDKIKSLFNLSFFL